MENNVATINPGRPVYFSYARNSSRKPEWEHISDCVEKLLNTLTANNLEYRMDVKDIGMGDKISQFEEEIGWNSEVVVLVFSDKYFRSLHCMYEFVQIKNALKQYPQKRLMCIKSGDFNLSDFNYIRDLERYWANQKFEYEDIEYHRIREHSETEKAAWQNGFYVEEIRSLYSFFSALNYSNASSIDYESFVGDIVKYYNTTTKSALTPKPSNSIPKPQQTTVTSKEPQFIQNVPMTTSAPQTKINKSLIIPIAIVLVVVVFLIVFFLSRQNNEQTDKDNNVQSEVIIDADDDAIVSKADELFEAGNYSEALVYYEELANRGYVLAQSYTGVCYDRLKKYDLAVEWFQKAADQGEVLALMCLGSCYRNGDGVTKNLVKAVELFQKAADQGDASALMGLGTLYYLGEGVNKDYKKAVELFQKAADQGNAAAQYFLGLCYLNGQGVPKNVSKAKEWLQKAADQGDEDAIEELKNL